MRRKICNMKGAKDMKRFFYFAAAILSVASCSQKNITPEVNPGEELYRQTEFVEFYADVREKEEGATKVDFEYSDKLYNRWEGNEEMDVYIKHNGTYEYAGRIPAVEGSLSSDKFSLSFAGDVKKRENPETDTFVMVYTNSGAAYDWTKQTLDMREEAAGTNGLKALKSFSPIVWDFDAETGTYSNMSNKACYIRFAASGLSANVKVKSLSIYNPQEAVFPKTFSLETFDYQSDNKSKTLSYVFENLETDGSGNLEIFLAAPIIPTSDKSGDKAYEIHVVTEDAQQTISTLSTAGIASMSAMSASKVYKLTRSSFVGATNPATTVGQTQGGSTGAGDVVIESIIGQWDKTGYLSNDIYGVLEMGKPENLDNSHNRAINAIQKIYNVYFSGNLDTKIHRGAVEVAGKAGQKEGTDLEMTNNGPQYVTSIDNDGTFNDIVLTKDTEVFMTFIDSKAWNTNTIGYYCYTPQDSTECKASGSHGKVHDLIVFPSTSQSTKGEQLVHKFEAKTTAQLLYPASTGSFSKKFPAGTTIGLMERVNALEDTKDFALKAISNSSPVHYTNIAWNKLNTLGFRDYWNQIAVLKFKMPEDADFNRHGLIYAMKDKYAAHGSGNDAANWTNPIILIYTSEPDAIKFSRSKDYWTHTVNISDEDATFNLEYNLDGVTSSKGDATIRLDSGNFTDGKYTTTLKVANSEFGQFSALSVTIGGKDVTSSVVKNNTGYQADIEIPQTSVCGNVHIKAHTARQIYAQSLTAEQLMALASNTAPEDLPLFRLILHSTTAAHGNVAFGLDPYGNSFILPQAQSPLYNANSQHTFSTSTAVKVSDQYNDYEWSIEKAEDSSGNFIGFRLKKVTKYADDDVRTDGFITRGPDYYGYPSVRLSDEGTVLTAEPVGSGYQMRIRSAEDSYQYMTCAIGQSLQSAIFNSAGTHTNQYGTWLVYMVTLSNN